METTAGPFETQASFAGALAAFASDAASAEPASPHDGLADDVATLSYESTVRAQAGYGFAGARAHDDGHTSTTGTPSRKSASITIRMSHAECAQLRKRADAADLTVSAYMRSCILEAETLRAQVKEALAALRAAMPDEPHAAAHTPRRWWQLGMRSS